jgi:hypothetical protein
MQDKLKFRVVDNVALRARTNEYGLIFRRPVTPAQLKGLKFWHDALRINMFKEETLTETIIDLKQKSPVK